MGSPEGPARHESTRGFTLIELLIVMVILGVLAAIAIPRLNVTRDRAFRSAILSDLKGLANAQEIYHSLNYTYSTDLDAMGARASEGVVINVNEATNTGWAATASHVGLAATGHCGMYYGDAAASGGDPADLAGVVSCNF